MESFPYGCFFVEPFGSGQTLFTMDLLTLFNTKALAMNVISDLQIALMAMERTKPTNIIHPSRNLAPTAADAGTMSEKPRTMSEFRRSRQQPLQTHGVAGAEVLTITQSAPLYEIQYVLLFAIYVSFNLRRSIARASPKPVSLWLEHMRFYFERHATCMHEQNAPHNTLLGTQGVVEYVMHTRLQIEDLYRQ